MAEWSTEVCISSGIHPFDEEERIGKEFNLKDNLRLFDEEYNKYLLVGNI